MKIEIRHRHNDNLIITGDYDNIKDCLEKNRGANLKGEADERL